MGVRKYYEKLGYTLQGVGNFMIKDLAGYVPGRKNDSLQVMQHGSSSRDDDEEDVDLDVADSDLCT